jgi:hypothetical protein
MKVSPRSEKGKISQKSAISEEKGGNKAKRKVEREKMQRPNQCDVHMIERLKK